MNNMLVNSEAVVLEAKNKIEPNTSGWRLGFSERKQILFLGDFIILVCSLFFSLWSYSHLSLTLVSLWSNLLYIILFFFIWTPIALIFGIYHLSRSADPIRSIYTTSGVVVVSCIAYLLIPFLSSPFSKQRTEIFLFPLVALFLLATWRYFYAIVIARPLHQQNVMIVGAGWAGETLAKILNSGHDSVEKSNNHISAFGYNVVGFIDDDPTLSDKKICGKPVLGRSIDLIELANKSDLDQLIVAVTHLEQIQPALFEKILECRKLGIRVTTMASIYEKVTGRVPVEHAGHNLNVIFDLNQSGYKHFNSASRRLLDIVIGLQGCLLLLLIIPFVWIVNRIYSPGPLFYRQERMGQAEKPFKIIKFRSMVVDAEQYSGAVWADEDDPRITKIGRLLRLTRLDEIPQFINILRGDMSLIGPRPERPYFVNLLAKEIPFYGIRHAVKPGLTGWAQVMYRYGASFEDSLIKLQYDLYYIKHQDTFLDLKIVLKTIGVVLGFKGR